MANGTISIVSNEPGGHREIALTSQIGNTAQSCAVGSTGSPVSANTLFAISQAAADALAQAALICTPTTPPALNVGVQSRVSGVFIDGSTIYLTGRITAIAADSAAPTWIPRDKGAAITTAGAILPFDPAIPGSGSTEIFDIVPLGSNFVIGGVFSTVGVTTRNRIAMVDSVGAVILTFNPNADATVRQLAAVAGNRVMAAGDFVTIAGVSSRSIVLLEANGTRVTGFTSPFSAGSINSMVKTAAGKYLVGADVLLTVAGVQKTLWLLNQDGTVDGSFTCALGAVTPTGAVVEALAELSDGTIVLWCQANFGAGAKRSVVKLSATGALLDHMEIDTPITAYVLTLASDGAGGFYAGGSFATIDGVAQPYLAHVKADFTVDTAFVPVLNGQVYEVLFDNTTVVAVGEFSVSNGVAHFGVIRLNGTTGANIT